LIGSSPELSSYSNKSLAATTIEQSYVFPRAITSIATTSTKYGISTKDIIGNAVLLQLATARTNAEPNYSVANENGQIQSFPRLLLNPRRTKDKPTAEEQEEWLVQYDPVLPDDTYRVLSHNYHVRGLSVLPFENHLNPFFWTAGCECTTHPNCSSTVGVNITRFCIWARLILYTRNALWYV